MYCDEDKTISLPCCLPATLFAVRDAVMRVAVRRVKLAQVMTGGSKVKTYLKDVSWQAAVQA